MCEGVSGDCGAPGGDAAARCRKRALLCVRGKCFFLKIMMMKRFEDEK